MREVINVISENRTPRGYTFIVLDEKQNTFSLFYNESTQVWTVKPWN